MPAKVDEIFKAIKKENPSMLDERAWAIAWSTYNKTKGESIQNRLLSLRESLRGV